ncbi:MAG: SsgA family sporulation/cell division regulator [Propionibacteriales bacterium]|nr:SsgA family sporulation/cell division regulator [Propionibacteriales bacterium]
MPASVTRTLQLDLISADGAATPLSADLRYDRHDPYAVTACFHSGDAQVQWVFARDLLTEGIYDPSGDGDVHVWPSIDAVGGAATFIELSSPDGEALIQARTDELWDFLARTEVLVPSGTESGHLDVDMALSHIFA